MDVTPPERKSTQSDISSPENIQKIFGHAVLTGLVGLLLLAFSFSYYVWRQSRELNDIIFQLSEQKKAAENFSNFYNSFLNEVANYSQQHPEIITILAKQGISVQQPAQPQNRGMPPMPPPPAQ